MSNEQTDMSDEQKTKPRRLSIEVFGTEDSSVPTETFVSSGVNEDEETLIARVQDQVERRTARAIRDALDEDLELNEGPIVAGDLWYGDATAYCSGFDRGTGAYRIQNARFRRGEYRVVRDGQAVLAKLEFGVSIGASSIWQGRSKEQLEADRRLAVARLHFAHLPFEVWVVPIEGVDGRWKVLAPPGYIQASWMESDLGSLVPRKNAAGGYVVLESDHRESYVGGLRGPRPMVVSLPLVPPPPPPRW